MNWNQEFKEYAVTMATRFKECPSEVISCLGFPSIFGSLNETYQVLVKEKEMPPIESLSKQEKIDLWEKSFMYGTDRISREKICRSIYLLEKLTA